MSDTTETAKPDTERVRAADVRPYEWALWCRIEGGDPFANEIVASRPSEDGTRLWFMLDTHNFWDVGPDDVLDLIPLLPLAEECEVPS